MMLVKILVMVLTICDVKSSTHWVVTEDGRIQQQLESPFAMKQPDDLVSFMRQQRTYTYLKKTKEKLLNEQSEIENNEDKDMQVENHHYHEDPDCRAAGQKLLDFDLFITSVLPFEHKDIKVSDHINIVKVLPGKVHQPNCTTVYDLPFSVHAYDHLEGVQNRHLFPNHVVSGLKSTMSFLENPDDAATAIFEALKTNSSSWVLYDLAAYYWRMKGDTTEAVECLRRALHFSPEKYKDIALVNLANILHRAQYIINATVLMHHALEISNEYSINFFTLANMYAALGEYNESIYYFEQTLKRQVDFETAKKKLAAVKCELKLQEKLENQHLSLQRTLQELQKYKVKHESFLEEQKRFTDLHLSASVLTDQHMIYEHQRMKEGTFNRKCQVRNRKTGSVLVCNLPTPDTPSSVSEELEEQTLFQKEPKPVPMTPIMKKENISIRRTKSSKPKRKLGKNTNTTEPLNNGEESTGTGVEERKYDPLFDWNNPNWPAPETCKDYADHYRAWDDFPSAYVDPETRGFKVRELLTSYIGIADGEMHGLPWNKPNCADLESIETTPYDRTVQLDSTAPLFKQDTFLHSFLLMHVNAGRVWPDDLGQRILSALQKALQNKDDANVWVLYNLAALFWRVNGDNAKAVQCLRRSVYRVPVEHADIPLVSMSNVMYRMGKLKDAVHLLIYALKVNNSEAATYLSMGNALQAQDNVTGAVEFYKYALVLNPQFQEAFHSLLIVKCHNLTDSLKEKAAEEVISNWNTLNELEGTKDNNDGIPFDNTDLSDEDKDYDSTEEDLATLRESNDIISKLLTEKLDADQLIVQSNDILDELQNTSSEELDSKMVTARELMEKLSKMQSSLKQLVKKATFALGDENHEELLSCGDPAVANMDFRFVSNASCLSRLKYTEGEAVKESDGLPPKCESNSAKNRRNIPSIDKVPDGPKERSFAKVLKKKLQTEDLEKALRSRLLSYPTSWSSHFAASYFWRISGDSKKAVDCLLASVNNSPDESSDHCSMYALSDYLAALSDFDTAAGVALLLSDTHHSVEVHYLLGNIFASNENYLFAAEHYKRALLLDDGFADTLLRFRAACCRTK